MDDMKRAIYLEILNELNEPYEHIFICNLLRAFLINIYGINYYECSIDEYFSEFYALFDGYTYNTKGRWEISKNEPWFSLQDKQSRIALVNFLLSNR